MEKEQQTFQEPVSLISDDEKETKSLKYFNTFPTWTIWLTLIALVSCLNVSYAGTIYKVTADKLNVRDKNAADGHVISSLQQNDTVQLISDDGVWGKLLVDNDTGFVSMEFLQPVQNENVVDKMENEWTEKQLTVFWICFALAAAVYIVAVVKVKRGTLVVINGWKDLLLLIIPWLVLAATVFSFGMTHGIFGNTIMIVLYVLSGLCVVASLVWSVVANWGNPVNVILSVVVKMIAIPLIGLGIFYLIYKLLNKTGIGWKATIFFAIIGVLIGGLIRFDD